MQLSLGHTDVQLRGSGYQGKLAWFQSIHSNDGNKGIGSTTGHRNSLPQASL
jgi:hypothetical protein